MQVWCLPFPITNFFSLWFVLWQHLDHQSPNLTSLHEHSEKPALNRSPYTGSAMTGSEGKRDVNNLFRGVMQETWVPVPGEQRNVSWSGLQGNIWRLEDVPGKQQNPLRWTGRVVAADVIMFWNAPAPPRCISRVKFISRTSQFTSLIQISRTPQNVK